MVVRKYRYILYKYTAEDSKHLDLSSSIINIIRDKVFDNYGEVILYRINNIAVIEYFLVHRIFIIRVDRDISKYVSFSLLSCGKINQIKISFSLVHESGILKKLMKKTLTYMKSE